uniref:Uncharacterized protein n=1 Tax=Cacopsylla melanoneura TaxID=428564 RepID=A0A8D8Y8P7_9HEMI
MNNLSRMKRKSSRKQHPQESKGKHDKLEIITTDGQKNKIDNVIYMNNGEIFTIGNNNLTLKKYILDRNATSMICSYTIEFECMTSITELDNETFISFEVEHWYWPGEEIGQEGKIEIRSRQSGKSLHTISNSETIGKIRPKVKYVNGFLIIMSSEYNIFDIDVYSLEKNKILDKHIIMKHLKHITKNDLTFETVGNSHLITFFGCRSHHYLTLWKLDSSDQTCVHLKTNERVFYCDNYIQLIKSTDNCFFLMLATTIELYKLVNDDLFLLKVVNRILSSSQLKTVSVFPIDNFNVILLQEHNQRKPEKNMMYVTALNLISNKSHQILEYNADEYNRILLDYPYSFILLKDLHKAAIVFMYDFVTPCYKLNLDDDKMVGILYSDIRKYARVLAQAHRGNTSLFSTLPLELITLIICKTRSWPSDATALKQIVFKYFCKP